MQRKIKNLGYFLFLLVSFTLVSCSDQEDFTVQETVQENAEFSNFTQRIGEVEELYSHQEMLFLGEEHNRYVRLYVDNYNNATNVNEVITTFLRFKDFEMSEEDTNSNLEYILNETLKAGENNFSPNYFSKDISSEALDIMLDVESNFYNENNLSNFSKFVFAEMEIVRQNSSLSIKEKNVIQSYSYTLEASARLWAPIELGGLGYFSILYKQPEPTNARLGWSWKRAVVGDAAGAGMFFLGVGLTIIVPPAGAAVLVSASYASASSSVVAGSGILSGID